MKGPAAATLYGADASAGVIQVITKRGRPGSGKFTQSLSVDYNSIDKNFTPRTNYGRCSAGNVADSTRVLCYQQPVNTLVSDNPLLREHAFQTGEMLVVNWSGRGGEQIDEQETRGANESPGHIQRQLVECRTGCAARKQAWSGPLEQCLRIFQ